MGNGTGNMYGQQTQYGAQTTQYGAQTTQYGQTQYGGYNNGSAFGQRQQKPQTTYTGSRSVPKSNAASNPFG